MIGVFSNSFFSFTKQKQVLFGSGRSNEESAWNRNKDKWDYSSSESDEGDTFLSKKPNKESRLGKKAVSIGELSKLQRKILLDKNIQSENDSFITEELLKRWEVTRESIRAFINATNKIGANNNAVNSVKSTPPSLFSNNTKKIKRRDEDKRQDGDSTDSPRSEQPSSSNPKLNQFTRGKRRIIDPDKKPGRRGTSPASRQDAINYLNKLKKEGSYHYPEGRKKSYTLLNNNIVTLGTVERWQSLTDTANQKDRQAGIKYYRELKEKGPISRKMLDETSVTLPSGKKVLLNTIANWYSFAPKNISGESFPKFI